MTMRNLKSKELDTLVNWIKQVASIDFISKAIGSKFYQINGWQWGIECMELWGIEFKKGDIVWFNPKDNKYDLKDCYEDDLMKDAKLMDENGFIKGTIIVASPGDVIKGFKPSISERSWASLSF